MLLASLLCTSLFLAGCGVNGSDVEEKAERSHKATLFKLRERPYGHLLLIDKDGKRKRYHLVKEGEKAPEKGRHIRVPVERIVCLSSTHAGNLLELKESEHIVGFPAKKYLYDQKLRKQMEEGRIASVGMQRNVNTERIVSLDPDILIDDGMSGKGSGTREKLKNFGIPTLDILAWKEEHPLGRTEWIRVFGALLGKEKAADSLFRLKAERYDSLCSLTARFQKSPKVLCNAPHKGTWHVPGGKSYMARLIRDAGGKLPWPDNEASGGVPKSLEEVIAKSKDADIWLNPGRVESLKGLAAMDPRLKRFKPFSKGAVYNNDRRTEPGRGNDFWESGPVQPARILSDLIHILHPDKGKDEKLYYHRELPPKPE